MLGSIKATLLVNYGPDSRKVNGVVTKPQLNALNMMIDVLEQYQGIVDRSIEEAQHPNESLFKRLIELVVEYGGDVTELHMFLEEVKKGLGIETELPNLNELWNLHRFGTKEGEEE
jgi:hypothetical protein